MKKLFLLNAVMLLLVSGLFANGTQEAGGEGKPEIVLRYGELNPDTHTMTKGAREFARIVEEKSNGRIHIEVYASGQLGDEKTEIQSVQMGALDMFRTGSSFLTDYGVDMMKVFELPYIFRDTDHAWSVLDSYIGKQFLDAIDEADIKMVGLGYYTESPRNYFFSEKKVTTVADMKGLKIRVPQSDMYMQTTNSFGASATPIAYSELYSALQTGVVDGAENALSGYDANKFYEVAKYYTFDGHSAAPYIVVFSELSWNKLSDEDKKIIQDSWMESNLWFRDMAAQIDQEIISSLESKGIEFFEVENKQEWIDSVKDLYAKYGAGYEDVISAIQATK